MKSTFVLSISAALLTAGCMGSSSQLGANATAISGLATVQRAANNEPTKTDLAKSCAQLDAELNQRYQRIAELEKGMRAQERKGALARGAVNTGIAAITLGGISSAGSITGLQTAGAAAGVAGNVANGAIGNSGPDARTTNETLAIYERTSLLERTKLKKGC